MGSHFFGSMILFTLCVCVFIIAIPSPSYSAPCKWSQKEIQIDPRQNRGDLQTISLCFALPLGEMSSINGYGYVLYGYKLTGS